MPDDKKMRKCRNCSKEHEVGKPCPECDWDEEAATTHVRKQLHLDNIRKELEKAPPKKDAGSKSKWGW